MTETSFDEFYLSELAPQVRRVALILRSELLANDVVHDVMLSMWARWDRIAEPAPYLNRAVLNRCRDLERSARRRSRRTPLLGPQESRTDEPEVLTDMLARLPFSQRAAIVLRYYACLSTDEIAAAMNCPTGSVGPWIARGLQTLREELSDQY